MIEPVASLVVLACANTPLPAGGSQCGKMGRLGLKIPNESFRQCLTYLVKVGVTEE
jgi:hypothetical protein